MDRAQAQQALARAWPMMVDEFRSVLGGELHYQAVAYHCLRSVGVPRDQVGMNVKQWIDNPVSELFRAWDLKKDEQFRGGFEPIPDIVVFSPDVAGDWRRRNYDKTLRHMLMAIEVKASERAGSRLSQREIIRDIAKLGAHREELQHRGSDMLSVMMVVDVAPEQKERMDPDVVRACAEHAAAAEVSWMYVSPEHASPALA
jgi:hypothetical protein